MHFISLMLSSVIFMSLLFLNVYSEAIIDLQEVANIVQRGGPCTLTQFPPVVTALVVIVQLENQETDIGSMCVCSSVPFYHLCRFVWPPPQPRYKTVHLHRDLPHTAP